MDDSRRRFYEAIATRAQTFSKGFYKKFTVADLKGLRFSRELYRGQHGLPMIVYEPPLPVVKDGKPSPRVKCSIFGAPSKMACLTFSLPAGPPQDKFQGTCPASGYDVDHPAFICNACYALGGNYVLYPDVIRKGMVLREWTHQAVRAGAFADLMTMALEHAFAIPARTRVFKDKKGKITDVSTNDYFRVHDSGDFFSTSYFEQWCQVASNFPRTLFWAPTRVCMNPDNTTNAWVRTLRKAPENLIVRPSTMYFEDRPPVVKGLAAGSTAARRAIPGVFDCRAYGKDSPAERNCKSAGCRKCWTAPDTPIRYFPHGGAITRLYKAAGFSVASNPPAAMEPRPDTLAGEGDEL